ncbi:LysR family transcriptional regulator [Rhodoferax sp.]|uniref:LysR family transcriptional regulator n=1 Tax=Rhodoferax sp. TaxID=50421 RepID=UPI0025E71866|nr:LysR family transcriptional regulator [Rhodoferax sp.]
MDVLRLTLRQLQIFVAVAHSGSTTAASVAIALSQSATSSAVTELERLLSLQLFDRVGKRLLLNDNGRALLPRALALLDGAAGIEQMARYGSGDGSGQAQSLRIGASTTIGNYVLPPLLGGWAAWQASGQASAWQSRVQIGNTEQIARAVAEFALDVGLIEGACHEATLQVTPWLQDTLVLVAAPTHPLAQGGTASLDGLREAVWLLREPGSGTRETTDQALLPHLHAYRRSIELGSSEAMQQAAVHGLGITCLSRWVVQDKLAAGQLRCLATPLPAILRQCHLIVPRHKQITPALQAFIAFATTFATTPGNAALMQKH